MKLYVIFLTFVLSVIVPINAYAIFPVIGAIAGSTSGRLLLPIAGSYAIKNLAPQGIKGLSKGAVALCIKYPKSCTALGTGVGLAIKAMNDDDITIENNITNNTVNIYKKGCIVTINEPDLDKKYSCTRDRKTACEYNILAEKDWHRNNPPYESWVERFYYNGHTDDYCNAGIVTRKFVLKDKTYVSDDDIYNYFTKYATDDDITNIYNYDYSKDGDVTINNQKYSGDTINNYKNEFEENNTKNVTENVKNNVVNKKYDIDEVNETNCSKDKDGKLDKCGADRDDDSSDSSTSDDNTTNNNTDDEPPIECNANGFYKKVCDWMDWTQKKFTPDKDTKPGIEEKKLDDIKTDRVKFNAQCPQPYTKTISVAGVTKELTWSWDLWCENFIKLKPYLIGLSWISAVLIITGVRKNG